MRYYCTFWFLILSALLLISQSGPAQEIADKENVPEIRAIRINPESPIIDGNLDDSVWQNEKLDFAREFRQVEPDEGDPATESTLVAVVYDDEAVYFAFWNFDSEPGKIRKQLVRRDRWAEADLVTVRLDPYHDHQTGFRFEVNASGVQRDFRLFNDLNHDGAWDGVWESGVKSQPWGWSAEIKIPYHCLRFTEKDTQTWGMNVTRYISRKDETGYWAFSPSAEGGHVSRFGHLTGLTGIKPARHLEILPYAVSSYESEPVSGRNPDGRDFYENSGFDIKYAVASNLILDAAINPDFGQVELDQPVLNLSTYETQYTEKRPFFLEGSDLFATNFTLFYSRRIGRPPRGLDNYDDFDHFTDYPSSTSILGAAKLTGKMSGGTSVGFLTAVTDEEEAKYIDGSGNECEGIVEPLADYTVMRLKQDVLSNSFVGGIFTLVSQDHRYPARTGGVDWRIFDESGTWGTDGQIIFSRVDNEEVGFGLNAALRKDAGKHIRAEIGTTIKDPHLDISRLGFTPRNDIRHTWAWVQYRTQDDWWIIRNSWNDFSLNAGWNYDGDQIELNGGYNFQMQFTNNWWLAGGISWDAAKYDDLETRGNGLWEIPVRPTFAWWANLETDQRKKVSYCINPGSGSHLEGSWWANYVGLEYRPRSNIEFAVGTNYKRDINQTRWVQNAGDTALFASMYQDQLTPRLSSSIMFHRNLSFQFSVETVMAGLDYRNVRVYKGDREYAELGPEAVDANGRYYEDKYDRHFNAINSTMILRWEYMPGSTLYLVWTRSRWENDYSVNNLKLSRDFDRFIGSGTNVFLIKASYWWNI